MADLKPYISLKKYYVSFLSTDDLKTFGSTLAQTKSKADMIFRAVQAVGLACLYWIWVTTKDREMAIDKQQMEIDIQNNLDDDNEITD